MANSAENMMKLLGLKKGGRGLGEYGTSKLQDLMAELS